MLDLEPAKLDVVLPTDSIDFVFMQPFLSISTSEPYIWLSQEKASQIVRIRRCLDIAAATGDTLNKTHFTVFPEYSIPGLEGVAVIQEYLESSSWKTGTIIIAGVDELAREEYRQLCEANNTSVSEHNRPEFVDAGEWVNCSVTWEVTEGTSGEKIVKRWIQPKLCPSGIEQQTRAKYMFEGRSVYIYESKLDDARTFRFFNLLCFDWTAPPNTGIGQILATLNKTWTGDDPKFIHLIFILQHNNKPNHTVFLSTAASYFNQHTNPFVSRGESILAFVNTAGKPYPGCADRYGFSSMVYSPSVKSNIKACPPSYAIHTQQLRESDALQTCRDSLFRENGACIHAFRAFQPRFMLQMPSQSRRLPLDHVSVHGIDDDAHDPRTPGGPVAAIVKWVNDRIEMMECMDSSSEPIRELLEQRQKFAVAGIRECDYKCLDKIISYADNYEREGGVAADRTWLDEIDEWTDQEENSLRTLVHALSLVGCKGVINIDGVAQAHMICGLDIIDIFVISGSRHKANFERVTGLYPGYQGRKVLIVSRDKGDSPTSRLDRPVCDTSDNIIRCGFHELKDCLGAPNMTDFMARLDKIIGFST